MNKRAWLVALMLVLVMTFTACSPSETSEASEPAAQTEEAQPEATKEPKADEKVTMTVGIASDPDTLNVLVSNEINTSLMLNSTYPSLVVLGVDGNKEPYIMEEPVVTEDGLHMTVTLLDDLYWTDGTPITAEDVVFTYDAIYEGKFHWTWTVLDGITWEATDDKTIEFTLSQPFPTFLNQIGFWARIVPKHIWEKSDDIQNFIDSDFIGFGPFKLVETRLGEFYRFERVEDFPFAPTDDKAYVDELIFKPYPDPNTLLLALKSGDIDVNARPSSAQAAKELEMDANITVVSTIDLGYEHMHFNLTDPVLSDVLVREAIAMTINRNNIVNFAYDGKAEAMPGIISPLYQQYQLGIYLPAYDIDGARALLEGAGYADTDNDGIYNAPGGENLSFELIYAVNYTEHEKIATVIAQDARAAGIELIPMGLDKPVQLEQLYREPKGKNNYQISINTWGIIDDVESSMTSLFLKESNLNWMNWENEAANEAMLNMKKSVSKEDVLKNMTIFQTEITADLPDVPLVVKGNTFAYNNKFKGFEVYPDDLKGLITPQNLWKVYLEE